MDLSELATPDPEVENLLRRHLAARGIASAAARPDLAAATRLIHRRRRRQHAALAATALAVAVIAGGVPALRAVLPAGQHVAAPPTPAAGPVDLYDLPTRGTLAADDGYLSALAARPWSDVDPQTGVLDPPPASHRVAFAGDVPGGRVALVLGRSGGKTAYLWFSGPAGAAPAQLTPATPPALTGTGQPVALLDVRPGSRTGAVLVVVGAPGDSADYVAGTTAGTGHPTDLGMVNGVALAEVAAPAGADHAGQVQVVRKGEAPLVVVPDIGGAEQQSVAPRLPIEDPRGLLASVDDVQVQALGRHVLGFYGVSADRLELVLLAAGQVGDREALLLGGILPSGQTVLWQGSYDRARPAAATGNGTAPGSKAPLLGQTVALRTDGGVVVSGPLDGVSAQVLDSRGAVLGAVPLVNGAGAGAVPGTPARVRILDGTGAVLADTAIRATR